MNHSELIAAGIGHPITNLLMQQAQAADMGAADHADAGAVVHLDSGAVLTLGRNDANIEFAPGEPARGVSGHATTGQADQVDPLATLADLAREELPEPVAGRVILVLEHMQRVEAKIDNLLVTLVRHLAGARG